LHNEMPPAETASGTLHMLTPDYASPEQVRGEPVTTASDIYSLAAVLYELLTGRLPFEGSSIYETMAAILSDRESPPLSRYSPGVPAELERIAVEVVSEQSYRRGSRHLAVAGEIPVAKSTLHRWVVQSPAAEWTPPADPLAVLMADGTGYKRRPDPAQGQDHRGELRVLVGRTAQGQWKALGAWSGQSWAEIVQRVAGQGAQPTVQADTLISDGENGLAQALAGLVNGQQRCPWHLVRDLNIALWKDQAPLTERREQQQQLNELIGIELPAGELETVKPEERAALRQRVQSAEQNLADLVRTLRTQGYQRAANYVADAQGKLFRYVEFWLETGVVCPRTTAWLERMMRELGRPLKKIGFGWSEGGAARMACVILRRLTDAKEWEEYWRQRLGLDNNVCISLRSVKAL